MAADGMVARLNACEVHRCVFGLHVLVAMFGAEQWRTMLAWIWSKGCWEGLCRVRETGFVEGAFGRVCVEFRLPRERVKFELGRFG